ncbi:MAG: TetR/AcrR family transcriptional regulator [Jatrophihabitans sp.]
MTTSDTVTVDEVAAGRPLRKDAVRNRQLLLDAGREVFAERGLDASLDDIAHRAGVGVGTAYRHFGNKHELAKAIFDTAVDGIVALAETALRSEDAWAGIVAFLEGAASAQAADRGLRDVLMGVHDEEQMEQLNSRLTVLLGELVERAKHAGSMRADAEVSDIGIVVMMLCTVADLAGDVAPDLWRRYLPMLLDGLRPGTTLPVAPLPEAVLRKAMATHKQRLLRGAQPD